MEFNSLEDLIRYVKISSSKAMSDVADKTKETLEIEIKNQVTGYEGYLFDAVNIIEVSDIDAEVEISDNQGWTSLISGNSFRNAMYGLEGGFTWGREQSNIMDSAEKTLETKVPKTYKDTMKNMGVPIV